VPLAGPAGDWQVLRADDSVVAFPRRGAKVRFVFRWPLGRVEWTLTRARELHAGQGCPVVWCDPATGQLVQVLNVPVAGPRLTIRPAEDEPAGPPLVQVGARTVVAVGGGRLWLWASGEPGGSSPR
jgi:hypothetical protein